MLSGVALSKYLNKVIHIKSKNGLYIRLTDVVEKNPLPTIDLVTSKQSASDFILIGKSDTNFVIRYNKDMQNQNGTFGYHLYMLPDTDLLYGAGNAEIYAQFTIESFDKYIFIKSAFKQSYLCSEYNIIRCRPMSNPEYCAFTLEPAIVPIIQNNICIISYGFLRIYPDIDTSPIIGSLKRIYPDSNIDIFMFLPNILDEFYNVQIDVQRLKSKTCNLYTKSYSYDIKHFMKLAHYHGLPIMFENTKIYPYRLLSMLWNISESIKFMLNAKKYYNHYILMRNDSYFVTDILSKQIDRGKIYCTINNVVDPHLIIGRDIMMLEYLYDFYVKNKNNFQGNSPGNIITEYFKINKIILGDIYCVAPINKYIINTKKFEDKFYRLVYEKYREIT